LSDAAKLRAKFAFAGCTRPAKAESLEKGEKSLKTASAARCLAGAALAVWLGACYANSEVDQHNRIMNGGHDPASPVDDTFRRLQAESARKIKLLEREIAEDALPHWVCGLTVHPQDDKTADDGCLLAKDADRALAVVEDRRDYIKIALGTSMSFAALGLAFIFYRLFARRLVRVTTDSAGFLADRAARAAEDGARMAGRASVVLGDKSSALVQAFREGRAGARNETND
jgi:hypothetical protein